MVFLSDEARGIWSGGRVFIGQVADNRSTDFAKPKSVERMDLSVIIPTLNEASCLAETLHSVGAERPHEIIVADGGSTDATRAAAIEAGTGLD